MPMMMVEILDEQICDIFCVFHQDDQTHEEHVEVVPYIFSCHVKLLEPHYHVLLYFEHFFIFSQNIYYNQLDE